MISKELVAASNTDDPWGGMHKLIVEDNRLIVSNTDELVMVMRTRTSSLRLSMVRVVALGPRAALKVRGSRWFTCSASRPYIQKMLRSWCHDACQMLEGLCSALILRWQVCRLGYEIGAI
jgi:hypothetical protein